VPHPDPLGAKWSAQVHKKPGTTKPIDHIFSNFGDQVALTYPLKGYFKLQIAD
jgi:hypothetical protein